MGTETRGGAHLVRERVFPSPHAEARAARGRDRRQERQPVFVDDSGRRHRIARFVGATAGGLVVAYLVVVGATFTGAPGLGRLDAPGLGQLTNPATADQADVGTNPVEQPVPVGVAGPAEPGEADATTPAPTAAPALDPSTGPTATTVVVPSTTTTTQHGRSAATPSSTVPDKAGGPPETHPGSG